MIRNTLSGLALAAIVASGFGAHARTSQQDTWHYAGRPEVQYGLSVPTECQQALAGALTREIWSVGARYWTVNELIDRLGNPVSMPDGTTVRGFAPAIPVVNVESSYTRSEAGWVETPPSEILYEQRQDRPVRVLIPQTVAAEALGVQACKNTGIILPD